MKPEEYLHTVTDQIRCAGARDMVEEELREHIRDQAEAYEAEGMFEEEALEKAVRDMGDRYTGLICRGARWRWQGRWESSASCFRRPWLPEAEMCQEVTACIGCTDIFVTQF